MRSPVALSDRRERLLVKLERGTFPEFAAPFYGAAPSSADINNGSQHTYVK